MYVALCIHQLSSSSLSCLLESWFLVFFHEVCLFITQRSHVVIIVTNAIII